MALGQGLFCWLSSVSTNFPERRLTPKLEACWPAGQLYLSACLWLGTSVRVSFPVVPHSNLRRQHKREPGLFFLLSWKLLISKLNTFFKENRRAILCWSNLTHNLLALNCCGVLLFFFPWQIGSCYCSFGGRSTAQYTVRMKSSC